MFLWLLPAMIISASGFRPMQTRLPRAAGPAAQSTSLRRAVMLWIAREREAYRRGDVAAFQPCPDPAAVVLRDVTGAPHECADVQAHMRSRMGGDLTIRVDSLRVRGDSGVVYNTVTFSRRVRAADRWEHREITAVHRDSWRRVAGQWRHIEMTELTPQRILIDGRQQPAQP